VGTRGISPTKTISLILEQLIIYGRVKYCNSDTLDILIGSIVEGFRPIPRANTVEQLEELGNFKFLAFYLRTISKKLFALAHSLIEMLD
jgi:hypothetical protein